MSTTIEMLLNSKDPVFVFSACMKFIKQINELLSGEPSEEKKNEAARLFSLILQIINHNNVCDDQLNNEIKNRIKAEFEVKEKKDLKDIKDVKDLKQNTGRELLYEDDKNRLCEVVGKFFMDQKSPFFKYDFAYLILLKISSLNGNNNEHDKRRFQEAQANLYKLLDLEHVSVGTHGLKDKKTVLRQKIKFYYQSNLRDTTTLKKMMQEYTETDKLTGIDHIERTENVEFVLGLLDDLLKQSQELRKMRDTISVLSDMKEKLIAENDRLKMKLLEERNAPQISLETYLLQLKQLNQKSSLEEEEPDADPWSDETSKHTPDG